MILAIFPVQKPPARFNFNFNGCTRQHPLVDIYVEELRAWQCLSLEITKHIIYSSIRAVTSWRSKELRNYFLRLNVVVVKYMERENRLHNKLSAPYTIIRSNLPEVINHLIYSHLLQVYIGMKIYVNVIFYQFPSVAKTNTFSR